MANPTLTPFPTPPQPEQDEVTFNRNAANSLLAQANFVGEANTVVTWMGQQVTDVASYNNAAADSATAADKAVTDAKAQAGKAKTSADQAMAYRDSAQVASSIAEKSANLPPIQGKAGLVVTVNADETGYSLQRASVSGFQEFTSSGTFPKPAGARFFFVDLTGAGGAGGVYSSTATDGNTFVSGGEGGDYNFKLISAADVPDSVSVSVGVGGNSSSSTSNSGGNGSASSFGSLLRAAGGNGGVMNSGSIAVPGEMRGGKLGGSSIKGAGAGALAALSYGNIRSSYIPGTSLDAGPGGSFGKAGGFPGGGGGAKTDNSGNNITAGNGAGGRVRIWWW